MRGCLTVLILAAAFAVGGLWFGGPALAGTIVSANLSSSGLEARELDVRVEADPPIRTALGQADRVSISASDVRWNAIRAASMSLILTDVDLLARTARTASGALDAVELPGTVGRPATADISFSGPAGAADTVVIIDRATVDRLAGDALERELGSRPDRVTVEAPSRLLIELSGQRLVGDLRVDSSGALLVETILGTVRVVEPDPAIPLRLSGVEAVSGRLELSGTLNIIGLLR